MRLAKRHENLRPSGMVRMFQAIERMEGVLNLSIGEPDFDTEPDIVEAAAKAMCRPVQAHQLQQRESSLWKKCRLTMGRMCLR